MDSTIGAQGALRKAAEELQQETKDKNGSLKGDHPVALFIDWADAYGSVDLIRMEEIIDRLKIWSEEEKQLWKWLVGRQTYMIGKEERAMTRGLPQGAKLSCELFIVYLGEFFREVFKRLGVSQLDLGWLSIKFVDDTVLITICSRAEKYWNVVKEVADEWGLKINVKPSGDKSAIMPLNESKETVAEVGRIANVLGLPMVKEYKYLGTLINSRLSSSGMLGAVRRRVYQRLGVIQCLLRGASFRFKVNTFVVYALPVLMMMPLFYGNEETLKTRDRNEFGRLFRELAKRWLGLGVRFSSNGLYTLVGTDPKRIEDFVNAIGGTGKDVTHALTVRRERAMRFLDDDRG